MKILNEMTGQEMFFLLAGPCVIEGEEMALKIAVLLLKSFAVTTKLSYCQL